MLQGLFFGRTAPHRSERRTFETPTLVIGHQFDIVHPFSDAGMLVDELPNARLLQASSILELRLAPERLTGEIAGFIEDCWRPRTAERTPAAARLLELADLREAPDGDHQLVQLGVGRALVGAGDRVGHAVAHVAVEDVDRHLLERRLDGGDLGEDVDAVGVLVDHPLEAPDLALDPAEAIVKSA